MVEIELNYIYNENAKYLGGKNVRIIFDVFMKSNEKNFSLHFPKIAHILIANPLEKNRAKQLELLNK